MPAPKKYDVEMQARAVRMFADRIAEGGISKRAARAEIGELLGINEATLRNWTRRELGEGVTPPAGWDEAGEVVDVEVARLRRENAQLRRANEILRTATAFFAAAELDRKLGS